MPDHNFMHHVRPSLQGVFVYLLSLRCRHLWWTCLKKVDFEHHVEPWQEVNKKGRQEKIGLMALKLTDLDFEHHVQPWQEENNKTAG